MEDDVEAVAGELGLLPADVNLDLATEHSVVGLELVGGSG